MLNNIQTNKLFNRKFVVTIKKNSLRCPKCRDEFSSNYEYLGDGYAVSARPFLMPCGHNICENCFNQNNQRTITCVECSKLIDLSAILQQPNQRRNNKFPSIRNYFDLNFFLVGQLSHVKYYYKDNNISISEITSLAQPKNAFDRQCSECEEAPALGKCKSCQVYMCQLCFNNVHRIAKTLQKHEWLPIDKPKENTNEYKLPSQKYCKRHNRIVDRKCCECRFICCALCIQTEHQNHNWCTIQHLNKAVLNQVDPLLEIVNKIRDSVKNAQTEVKYIEGQLEEYAVKALEDISKYFLKLHSFLQNEEKRLINEFLSLSQRPQINLNQAFHKFTNSYEVLNSMRNNLEKYRNVPPKDVLLKTILTTYKMQLNNMPCRLNISGLQENPFRFKTNMNVLNDLPKYYESSFKDPEISVSIGTLSETSNSTIFNSDQTLNSSPECNNVTMAIDTSVSYDSTNVYFASVMNQKQQHDTQQYSLTQTSKNITNNKVKKNKNMNNDNNGNNNQKYPNATKENQFFNDTTTGYELHNKSFKRKSSFNDDGEELVKVTYIKSPDNFYVQNINRFQQVKTICDIYYNDKYSYQMPQVICENQPYMIYHNQDKKWYRAMIKKILPNNLYQIYLIDFGIHMEIAKECVYKIENDHLKIPFAAIHCSINDLIPVNGREWTEDAKLFLMEVLQNEPAYLKIVANDKDDLFIVDLHNNLTPSVRESLLYSGLALDGSANGSKHTKKISSNILLQQPLPQYNFQFGEMFKVIISHVESPEEFYVIKNDLYQQSKDFAQSLNDYCRNENTQHTQLYLGYTHTSCMICINDVWQRATIEDVKGNGNILVRYVDNGTSEIVCWRQAYLLPKKFFNINEYAIRCTLADIQPAQRDGYVYSAKAINDFKQMVINPNLRIEILGKEDNEYKVILYISKKMLDINVGASLVKNGHGISIGEATQFVEITKKPTITTLSQHIQCLETDDANDQNNDKDLNVNLNKEQENDRKLLQRTTVLITHVINPGEFYVQLADLVNGVEIFNQKLQATHNLKYKQTVDQEYYSQEWQLNDFCVVYLKYTREIFANVKYQESQRNSECAWYRGIIKSIAPSFNQTYTVFLRDIGVTLPDVPNNQIYPIDDQLNRVANVAYRCHLAGIASSIPDKWSHSSVDFFKASIKRFESMHVTMQGKCDPETTSLPVILWGLTLNYECALSPCLKRFVVVNRMLVKSGLAYMIEHLDEIQQLDVTEEIDAFENKIKLNEWMDNYNDTFPAFENIHDTSKNILNVATSDIMINYSFERDPNGLNMDPTTEQTMPPLAWLKTRLINKTIFTGYPTYVDHQCIVYIQDSMDRDLAEKLGENLGKTYGILPQPPNSYKYLVGQPCVASFKSTNMNKLYRCIVIQTCNKNKEWGLFYIDYGNIEHVLAKYMRPYAPYPNFPALLNKFRIDGIKPKGDAHKFSVKLLDFIHANLVGQHITVRVSNDDATPNDYNIASIRMATIQCGSIDVKDYAVNTGYIDLKEATTQAAAVQDDVLMETLNFDGHDNDMDKNHQEELFEHLQNFIKKMAKKVNGAKQLTCKDFGDNNKEIYKNDNASSSAVALSIKSHDYTDFLQDTNIPIEDNNQLNDDDEFMIDNGKQNAKTDDENKSVELLEDSFAKSYWFMDMLHVNDNDNANANNTDNTNDDDNNNNVDNNDNKDNNKDANYGVRHYKQSSEEQRNLFNLNDNDRSMLEIFAEEKSITTQNQYSLRQQQSVKHIVEYDDDVNTSMIHMNGESEFDDFNPNATSSVNTHISCLRYFEEPHLPLGIKYFQCCVISVLTPTILQIVPFNTEFIHRFRELMFTIKEMVDTLPLLETIKPGQKCLACYSKDKIWYRAVICTYHSGSKMAQVIYVDYLNSETLPIHKLKELPDELVYYPLRTLRVRLHDVQCNPLVNKQSIRIAVEKALKQRKLLAIIKKRERIPTAHHAHVQQLIIEKMYSLKEFLPDSFGDIDDNFNHENIMQIVLYETETLSSNNILAYKSLLDNHFFLEA